jgi:RNA polymerase sigma factor (sigma-70 family)
MTESDEALMLAVRNGDVGKLGILFERYHRGLFDFFSRLTGNRTLSEDLVQDVFFRILKYRNTYRDESHFTTWMYHIARNVRFDQSKKLPREVAITADGIQSSGHGQSVSKQLERDQESELLHRALMKLPEDKRELLVLARYREMKHEQIAQLLSIDAGAVKVRIHRAVKELRAIFVKLAGEKAPCNVKRSEVNLRIM